MIKKRMRECTRPEAIQDVDEFDSLSEHIWKNAASNHLLCSEWVPSEWESKQLIKASQ